MFQVTAAAQKCEALRSSAALLDQNEVEGEARARPRIRLRARWAPGRLSVLRQSAGRVREPGGARVPSQVRSPLDAAQLGTSFFRPNTATGYSTLLSNPPFFTPPKELKQHWHLFWPPPFPTNATITPADTASSACTAAQTGQVEKLRKIITTRPEAVHSDGTADGGSGYTPLHYAARGGHVEAVKLLIGAGKWQLCRLPLLHSAPFSNKPSRRYTTWSKMSVDWRSSVQCRWKWGLNVLGVQQ